MRRREVFKPGMDFRAGRAARGSCSPKPHAYKNKIKWREKRERETVSRTIYSILSIPRLFKEVVWGLGKLLEISVCELMLIRHPWRCLSVCREDNVGFFYLPSLRVCLLTFVSTV